MVHICPVCGYPELAERPRTRSGGGSYEICPSCGFEFGVSDEDAGFSYSKWRKRWQQEGMRWASKGVPVPGEWDPATQLQNLRRKPAAAGPATPRKKK